ACRGASGGSAAAGDTLWVGVAVGLKNPERYVNVFEGVQIALDELNAKRPPGASVLAMRRPIANAKTPVEIAVAFRDDPRVIGVVGHTESGATIEAGGIYSDRANQGKNALAAVSPTAGSLGVTRSSEWIFRVCPTTDQQSQALARYLADTLGVKSAAMLYTNDAAGSDLLKAFIAEFSKHGGVVTERDPLTDDVVELDAYPKRIVSRRTPSAVIAANTNAERPFVRALRAAGGRQIVLGTNPPEVGDSSAQRDLTGARFVQLFSASHPATPVGARFTTTFRQKTGRVADRWGALAYDAAMLIGHAAQSEGGDRRRIRDWIAAVGRGKPAFTGATGTIQFDEHRDPVNKHLRIAEANQ
ncbi:MAG: ABC transporter substrate-binding protein, partial [Gemmatimonadaceae bacterium]|nr:ABC transporter substrate-binding protein [Gemmatimonadaceae bacterium]